MSKTRQKQFLFLRAKFSQAYSGKLLVKQRKSRNINGGATYENLMRKKSVIDREIAALESDLNDSGKLKNLKQDYSLYKYLFIRIKRRADRHKNAEEKELLGAAWVDGDRVVDLITDAELTQYESMFEKSGLLYVPIQKVFVKKTPCKTLRRRTIADIYKERYTSPESIAKRISEIVPENPIDLYPGARYIHRHFIIHSGMTNTGKTYNALKRLKEADTGVYLAPLRLLATDVQRELLFDNIMCNLITGEERNIVPYASHIASTVEMANIYESYDVAVIDECQMINDKFRGAAWTRAILGIKAREIHLCTAPEATDLLIRLISECLDSYEVINYGRRVPIEYDYNMKADTYDSTEQKLSCAERLALIGDGELEYGDAIIAFSKKDIIEYSEILEQKGIAVSKIYGALPYETRKYQLNRFLNHETDIIVATDAIGMGLNLPIRRVIFTGIRKFDGIGTRRLNAQEVKQIAGRAGRRGIFDKGYVVSLEDPEYVINALDEEPKPIKSAYIDFDVSFMKMEFDVKEILRAWSSVQLPFDLFKKEDIRRTVNLIAHAEKICREENLTCDKRALYTLATIAFDEGDRAVFGLWKRYVKEYLKGVPVLSDPKVKTDTIEDLEVSFKKFDLYYAFCRTFEYPCDLDWISAQKSEIARLLNQKL